MTPRLPQINFQVQPAMKTLYEEAKVDGHGVTRLCAAGLLLMIEDPQARQRAVARLRDWEIEYEAASAEQLRAFVRGARVAMKSAAPKSPPDRKARAGQTEAAGRTAARGRAGARLRST